MNLFRAFERYASGLTIWFYVIFLYLCSWQPADANVYATAIRLQGSATNAYSTQGSAVTISYILNEPASIVTIEIFSGTNVIRTFDVTSTNGISRGHNTVIWDGNDDGSVPVTNGVYSVQITAKSNGYLDWTQITDDSQPGCFVWEPRAIAVNCNSNSPFYGRIFVGNSHANPSRSTEPGDHVGVLKLNADASAAEEGEFSDGGYPWAGDFFSPWKIEVSADDKVYVNDWTGNGIVIAFDQLISTNYQIVLGPSNWPIVGVNPNTGATNYANLSGPFITGTGTNTQIWMADISFNQDAAIAHSVGVRRWNVTTNGAVAADDLGTTIIQAGFGSDLNLYPYDVCVDTNGNIYPVQYRANPADTANKVFQFPAYDESGNPELAANWKVGGPDNFQGAFGVAVNRSATLVAVALREGGRIEVLDAATGTNVTTITVALGHDRRDVAWDNVGNLYSVDNYDSIWRAFSPPGTNQATTRALQNVRIIEPPALTSPTYTGTQLNCLLSGVTNFNYIIQSSTNLIEWAPTLTTYLTNSPQPISIEASNEAQFIRAIFAP